MSVPSRQPDQERKGASAKNDHNAHDLTRESLRASKADAGPANDDDNMIVKTAKAMGGVDVDEARKLGVVDEAETDVKTMFKSGSPVSAAIWGAGMPELSFGSADQITERQKEKLESFLLIARTHKEQGTLLNAEEKISEVLIADLARDGYWGLLIPEEYGGLGLPFNAFAKFLTEMAKVNPTIAGYASVHGCIGAVDPICTFGTEAQKERYLPRLASGEFLSCFALTEPGAGSDLTAIKTTAELDGDDYVLNGKKLFITNAAPGRLAGVVCLIDGKPNVMIVELPHENSDTFEFQPYDIHAIKQGQNTGFEFKNFRVPKENLLRVPLIDKETGEEIRQAGKGLMIAYHGLNRGRVALAANAAGVMRRIIAGSIPWTEQRVTYTKPIGERELVEARLARIAALVTASDAIVDWSSKILDDDLRGEAECIIGKIFGSEAQAEAVMLGMKTHGGRTFLKGHEIGDNLHDLFAPLIYEGEGEMLGMAFLKALVKSHGSKYLVPLADRVNAVKEAKAKKGIKWELETPREVMRRAGPVRRFLLQARDGLKAAWVLRRELPSYAVWKGMRRARLAWRNLGRRLGFQQDSAVPESVDRRLRPHVRFAVRELEKMSLELDGALGKHKGNFPNRQLLMRDLSQKAQDLMVVAITGCWASRQEDPVVKQAAEVLCADLRMKITGEKPTPEYYKLLTSLGKKVYAGEFSPALGVEAPEILKPYEGLRRA